MSPTTFIIKSQLDVQKLIRKNAYDDLIEMANGLDGEYGKNTATLLMKDFTDSKAGKFFLTLLKKGATFSPKAKPGPKPGSAAKRKSPGVASPKRKEPDTEAEDEEPEAAAADEPEADSPDEAVLTALEEGFDSPAPAAKKTKK